MCRRALGVWLCVLALGCGGGSGPLRGMDAASGRDGAVSGDTGDAPGGTDARDAAGATDAPNPGFTQTFTLGDGVDILFMIDDSLSMQAVVTNVMQSFSAFSQALEPASGMANFHIAVVSSDLGAGLWTGIPQCAVGGEFQYLIGTGTVEPGGMFCSTTGLQAGAHFISNVGGVVNYDTTLGLDKVFSCIATLGDHGCGFEHQLQSVVRALNADGLGLPASNANFLRPDARLVIILITNEDDCSAPPTTDLFDPTSKSITDPLGPFQSYRCNEFGHLCNGAPPPRTMAADFGPEACVPAEGAGKLIPVANIITEIKALKSDPSRIAVAAIAGPPDPYSVVMVAAQAGTADAASGVMWPNVAHSCMASVSQFADPGVRIKAFVDAFGVNGLFQSACAASFASTMQVLGQFAAGPPGMCLDGVPPGVDPLAPSVVPPSCAVIATDGTLVQPCTAVASGTECFTFLADPACPGTQLRLSFEPNPTMSVGLTLHCAAASGD